MLHRFVVKCIEKSEFIEQLCELVNFFESETHAVSITRTKKIVTSNLRTRDKIERILGEK